MARPPRKPRSIQRLFLSAIDHLFKREALGAHLRAKGMGEATRVSKWKALAMHMRFDELWEVLNHLGPEGAKIALNYLAEPHDLICIDLPRATVSDTSDLTRLALATESITGRLSEAVIQATEDDSDGGAEVTDAEWEAIEKVAREAQEILARIQRRRDAGCVRPVGGFQGGSK